MKTVFVDTSGFYAAMDNADPFHAAATGLLRKAVAERWTLVTTNYVLHESWALIQRRLGTEAVADFARGMLTLCDIVFVNSDLHNAGARRCLATGRRQLSLTDCISLEWMQPHRITEAIAQDVHFTEAGIRLPS